MRRPLGCSLAVTAVLSYGPCVAALGAQEVPLVDVGAGYSRIFKSDNENFAVGGLLSTGVRVVKEVAVVVEISRSHKKRVYEEGFREGSSTTTLDAFLVGFQLKSPSQSGTFRAFFRSLGGPAWENEEDSGVLRSPFAPGRTFGEYNTRYTRRFAVFQTGAGADIHATDRFGIRIALDYRAFRRLGPGILIRGGDEFRFTVGMFAGLGTR